MTDPHTPTHIIEYADLDTWLAEYGFDSKRVITARVVLDVRKGSLGAWLDIEWYKLNEKGNLYVDPQSDDQAARGISSIPLRSWPSLSPLVAEPEGTVVCPACGARAQTDQVHTPTATGEDSWVPGSFQCANGHTFATPG